jgi:hypothetical protein
MMLIDKRVKTQQAEDCIEKLSIYQEMALIEVFQVGFSLLYTRQRDDGVLATANRGKSYITIDPSGYANYSPMIDIR